MNANQPSNVRPSALSVAFISVVGMRAGVAFKRRRGRNEMEITRRNNEWQKYEVVPHSERNEENRRRRSTSWKTLRTFPYWRGGQKNKRWLLMSVLSTNG